MGGVDTLDEVLSSYRPLLRSKKWWWNLFSNALNVAVVAAWRLHSELHQGSSTAPIRSGPRAHPPATLRTTRGHFLEPIS
ncbi:PiggyBac transposable element-derived protein 1 [Trichinella zimbabwensis]|uniref:PiggyBac transposable element-derived protein 1 n=1 Tax=Trichinella zimbabwensis TaxID=268475 RepID=A0A0V1GVY4_9BILA|nr:PiggyBac transposable element-derived protein 1 [Trichinella zimbabwensis]